MRLLILIGLWLVSGALACNETILLHGGNPYREANAWPVLAATPAARSTLVLVGSRMEEDGALYKAAFEGPSGLNGYQSNFPKIDNITLDVSRVPDEQVLIAAINDYVRDFAILQFAAHSNESVVEINSTSGRVYLRVEHLAQLQLDDKIVILTGCSCGMTTEPAPRRLMDRLMADTRARAVLGMKRPSYRTATQVFVPTETGGHELVAANTYLDDFVTPVWHVQLQGGTYRSPPIYYPFDSMDPQGALEREAQAAGITLPPWDFEMPDLDEPDPLTQWRILVREP